jgi:hypothetical protein
VIYIVPKTDLQNFPDFIEQMKKQASFVQQRGITLNEIVKKNDLFEIPTGNIHIADTAEFFLPPIFQTLYQDNISLLTG